MKNSAGLSKIFLRVYYSLKYMNTQRTKRVTFSTEYAKLLLLLASCLSTQKKKNNLELLQEPVNFTKF